MNQFYAKMALAYFVAATVALIEAKLKADCIMAGNGEAGDKEVARLCGGAGVQH